MFKLDYDYKKHTYDGLREFCMCERVDEAYMRNLVTENRKKYFSNIRAALKTLVVLLVNGY